MMRSLIASFILCFLASSNTIQAQQQVEFLNRGVYAINQGNGKAFVSWRLLGTEANDLTFNLYRTTDNKTVKLNKQPLAKETHFIDETLDTNKVNTYTVKSIEKGK